MKKRNKKYIPLEQKISNKLMSQLGNVYEFDMQFEIEQVNNRINAWRDENDLDDETYCPEWLVIDTYEQQDLIIALKMQQVKDPEYWHVGIDSHFYNLEKEDLKTIPFSIELPQMSHADLMIGCDVKVNRGSGIKTRWKGLQTEMLDHWKEVGIEDGYDLIKSQVYIKANAKFKNLQMLKEHNFLLGLRDKGKLIESLKKWNDEQVVA